MTKTLSRYSLVFMAGALLLSSCNSKMKDFKADYFKTNPNPLEVVRNQVPATVTGNIPSKFFAKNATVTVTPVLTYGAMNIPGAPQVFQGQDVRGNDQVVSFDRGGLMTIPVNYNYQPAMRNCELWLDFKVNQKGKQYALPRVQVAKGVIATSTMADATQLDPAIAPDAFQRVINEKYSADIHFLINQANLRHSELDKKSVIDLKNVLKDANQDAFQEIREINVQSYASPEGSLDYNTRLAENREKNTQNYMENQLKKDKITEFGELTAQFTPEDWEGFQKLVAQSDIQDKDLILSVLSMYKDPEEREKEIRNLSHIFEQLADQILPQLRYSRITASIDVIGKSDNEINRAFDNNPTDLNVEEMLYAATITEDPARQKAVYKKVTEQFPNDYRGWNNLGREFWKEGRLGEAQQMFDKAAQLSPSSPEVAMNNGLIALVDQDFEVANTEFGRAAGLTQLSAPLGVYYMGQGDYAAAVRAFGDDKSNNAALAQILNKDYTKARYTLDAIRNPNAETYYLRALLGARTGNQSSVLSNLVKLNEVDPTMYKNALSDLEFSNYRHLIR